MTWTPEGEVKRGITKVLQSHGVYYFMPVQHGYGKRGLDYFVCAYGCFVAIEAKAPGEDATKIQKIIAEEIVAAGGITIVCDDPKATNVKQVLDGLRNFSRQNAQPRDLSLPGATPKPVEVGPRGKANQR